MGLFALNYKNIPGQCIFAYGGLKFRSDEEALRRYFAPILSPLSLNDLIGEAVFWNMLPDVLAIWLFPLVFYRSEFWIVFFISFFFAKILHMWFYWKPLNYLVFIFGNRVFQFLAYAILIVIFILKGDIGSAVLLAVIFSGFFFGVFEFLFGTIIISFLMCYPFLKKLLFLPESDQVLWAVGQFYRRKFGTDEMTLSRKNYPLIRI